VWEARSLYFVAVALPFFWFLYPPAMVVIGAFGVLVTIVVARPCFFFLGEIKDTCC
jgi:hypothetical protein